MKPDGVGLRRPERKHDRRNERFLWTRKIEEDPWLIP